MTKLTRPRTVMPAASRHRAEHAPPLNQHHRHHADQAATRPTNPPNPVVILNDDFVCKISDGQQLGWLSMAKLKSPMVAN
jgi:hypothetical protein